MTDFPVGTVAPANISTVSRWSAASALARATIGGGAGAGNSGAWGTANRALYVPIIVPGPFIVRSFFAGTGGTASGNIDIGLYSPDGALIASKGSTAQANVNLIQILTITEILVPAGRYYLALAASSTSTTFSGNTSSAIQMQRLGIIQADSQLPLATTPTFATVTETRIPNFGMSQFTTY